MGNESERDYGRESWVVLTGNGRAEDGLVYKVDHIGKQIKALVELAAQIKRWLLRIAAVIVLGYLGLDFALPAAGVNKSRPDPFRGADYALIRGVLASEGIELPPLDELRRTYPMEGNE